MPTPAPSSPSRDAGPGQADFIEVYPQALDAQTCAAIVARMRQRSDALQPGRVGGGVFPELKHSRDVQITGNAD